MRVTNSSFLLNCSKFVTFYLVITGVTQSAPATAYHMYFVRSLLQRKQQGMQLNAILAACTEASYIQNTYEKYAVSGVSQSVTLRFNLRPIKMENFIGGKLLIGQLHRTQNKQTGYSVTNSAICFCFTLKYLILEYGNETRCLYVYSLY